MHRKYVGKILGVIGLVLLLSAPLTWAVGSSTLALGKVVLALSMFAFYAVTNFGDLGKAASSRGTFFYATSAVSLVVVVLLLVFANYSVVKNPKSWDLTKAQLHTLSPDTLKTLEGLKSPVTATAFYASAEPQTAMLTELFQKYAGRSEHFKYEFVDPAKEPLKAKEFNAKADSRIFVRMGATEARMTEPTEEALTNAIVKVTHSVTKKVYFTTGHGESDPDGAEDTGLAQLKKRMENEGLKAEKLNLASPEIPADAQAIVVAGPSVAFQPGELEVLKKYLQAGGKALVMVEPQVNAGLDDLLKSFSVQADDALVVDPISRLFGASEVVPVVQNYNPESDITRDFRLNTVFPTARPLTVLQGEGGATAKPVALSMQSAWGELNPSGKVQKDDGEKSGPFPLAVQATLDTKGVEGKRSEQARLVVVGDRDFATNKYCTAFGNEDFFLNALSWLTEQTERITIRPRLRDASRLYLTPGQQQTIYFMAIDVLPVTLLAIGLAVWMVRRSK